jgi:tRNA threonylcarbamoyladenosine biosynthesis protein TsaE
MSMQGRAESAAAMTELGRQAAGWAKSGTVIALVGDLGAGKTHWTKGLVAALGCTAAVTSPTFSLVNEYRAGDLSVLHFDFYRLRTAAEVVALGWDEYLEAGAVVIVEWADKFAAVLPQDAIWLRFTVEADETRLVTPMVPAPAAQ